MSTTRNLMVQLKDTLKNNTTDVSPSLDKNNSQKNNTSAIKLPICEIQENFLKDASQYTTALVGVCHSGTRYLTDTVLQFQAELAIAHEAVQTQLPENWVQEKSSDGSLPSNTLFLHSKISEHREFLLRPDLGRRLDEKSVALLEEKCIKDIDVQVILADGLSAKACIESGPLLMNLFVEECKKLNLSIGTPVVVKYARVWLEDEIGEIANAKVSIILLGERPGLGTGDGLSAYLIYKPKIGKTDGDRNMMSNIHQRGIVPKIAANRLAHLANEMIEQQTSGVNLDLSKNEILKELGGDNYREPQKRVSLITF